jgi:hypothetical protein
VAVPFGVVIVALGVLRGVLVTVLGLAAAGGNDDEK